jgi:hypothetical protein
MANKQIQNKQVPKKPLIYAFGFDKLQMVMKDFENDEFAVRFLGYNSTEQFDRCDGLVIPSGIFERETDPETFESDRNRLADCEKKLVHGMKREAWTCFLLTVLSNGLQGYYKDTDLAKKCANDLFQYVEPDPTAPNPHIACKADEFKEFFRKFGIARTAMSLRRRPSQTRILARAPDGHNIYAAKFSGKLFLLPFKQINDLPELSQLLILAIKSILTYKRRNNVYLPDWVDQIRFKRESRNEAKLVQLKAEITHLEGENSLLRAHKGILVASGYPLVDIVVNILQEYLGVRVERDEEFVEDAIIKDTSGNLKFVVEIKGENGGLKRQHVNQVDNHRERLGMDSTSTGLLILNDFANTDGLEERKAKQLSKDQLDYAKGQNVRVLRAVTLLELMLALEDEPNRAQEFLKRCDDGEPLVIVD